jgi:hypothetical protein
VLAKYRNRDVTKLAGTQRERSFRELTKGLTSSTVPCRRALRLCNGALLGRKVGCTYHAGAVTFAELFAPPLLMDKSERDQEREVGTC